MWHNLRCCQVVLMSNTLSPDPGACAHARSFRMGRQEDAHEYLVGLLDAMHEGVLAGVHPRPPRETAETSFIYRIFAGRLRSQVWQGMAVQRHGALVRAGVSCCAAMQQGGNHVCGVRYHV